MNKEVDKCIFCEKAGSERIDLISHMVLCGDHHTVLSDLEKQQRVYFEVRGRVLNTQKEMEISFLKKKKTRYETNRLIKKGEIQRKPCAVCGTTEKVQVHHLDYDDPRKVEFLCSLHHRDIHRIKRAF